MLGQVLNGGRFQVQDTFVFLRGKLGEHRVVSIVEMAPGWEREKLVTVTRRAGSIRRLLYKSKPLRAMGVGSAYVVHFHAVVTVCEALNHSLAVLAFDAGHDEIGLRKYVNKLIREEARHVE